MLNLLSFLTCLALINAHYIRQYDTTVAIADCKLPRQEHLNLEGLGKIKKENVEEVALKDCNGVIDDKTFTELPNLASLYIQDSNIEEINTVLSIKKLEVRNSSFPNLDGGLQQKLPNLTNLKLWSNKAFQVDPNILKNFKNLTELIIQANFIEDCITNEWFKGLDLLQKLVLGDNNISCISEDAFNSLKNLKTLRIGHNNFTTFKKLTKLTTLKFHGNGTENIDLNIFASQKNHLEELSIHWNVLTQNKITAEELLKAFPKLNELVVWRMTNNFEAKEFCQIVRQNGASCATPVLPGGMV